MENEQTKIQTPEITSDQKRAIEHVAGHARLLAGPGTGKTHVLTQKVLWLILQQKIDPSEILILTFTRLAAGQLKSKLQEILKPHNLDTPSISTLHSFALKQILNNSRTVRELPTPVRIADDWEERMIIQEDLKKILALPRIEEVQELIQRLSADWEMLKAEEAGWRDSFPNPRFIGAFEQHKTVYGETLRAELVYRLKRSLDQSGEFKLDKEYKYVLVDEYQDLNACDLAVIRALSNRGAKLFVVGDDDQSIYGFRFADPAGIRQFPEIYTGAERLDLEICFRCDKEVLRHAEFVADQDVQRLPKKTRARDDAAEGKVRLVQFANQEKEALGIANKIKQLIDGGLNPEKIVILSRSSAILEPIKAKLKEKEIKVSGSLESELEKTKSFRIIISLLRLVANREDDIALRTIIQLEDNNLGEKCIEQIWQLASGRGIRFSAALKEVRKNPSLISKYGSRLQTFLESLETKLTDLIGIKKLPDLIEKLVVECAKEENSAVIIRSYFKSFISEDKELPLDELLRAIGTGSDMIEQETEPGAVSVLTMHKAKGLTFDVCFIVGAEDEFLPGRNEGESLGDERRLLYVSMTRAKHELYISYCTRRTGNQRFFGRVPKNGQELRSLTRFLKNAKIESITTKQ